MALAPCEEAVAAAPALVSLRVRFYNKECSYAELNGVMGTWLRYGKKGERPSLQDRDAWIFEALNDKGRVRMQRCPRVL